MKKAVRLAQQAYADYQMGNFRSAFQLMHRSLQCLGVVYHKMSDAQYNVLYDAYEMCAAQYGYCRLIEPSGYSANLLANFKLILDRKRRVSLVQLNQVLVEFSEMVYALYVIHDFCFNNDLNWQSEVVPLSFSMDSDAQLKLHIVHQNQEVQGLIDAFNACFYVHDKRGVVDWEHLQQLQDSEQQGAAVDLIKKYIGKYPKEQKTLFLKLAEVYFEQEDYVNAVDAYMKTVVFGTPKEQVAERIRFCCNYNARYADNPKEASRWRDLIYDFFG